MGKAVSGRRASQSVNWATYGDESGVTGEGGPHPYSADYSGHVAYYASMVEEGGVAVY